VISERQRDRSIRDRAIRGFVDRTGATYRDTARLFDCSIDTVKRACKNK